MSRPLSKFSCSQYLSIWFSLVLVVSYSNITGSITDDLYWTSRKNSLELIELSSINKVIV